MLCETNARLDEAAEDMKINDQLNDTEDEEVVFSHEKIDALECQNTLSIERLEKHARMEDEWKKRKHKDKEWKAKKEIKDKEI